MKQYEKENLIRIKKAMNKIQAKDQSESFKNYYNEIVAQLKRSELYYLIKLMDESDNNKNGK